MMFLIALLAALAAPPTPRPADLKLYKDWTVGCDNGRHCQAVALMPEDMPEDAATIVVERGPAADAVPQISFSLNSEAARGLAADRRKLDIQLVVAQGGPSVGPKDVPKVLAALRSAVELELLDAGGKTLARVSLAGASAALLYMDDQQKRIGTVTALARPGPAAAATVPSPPALPEVRAAPVSKARPIILSAARVKALRKERGCEIDEVGGPDEMEIHALDARRSLVLLACGSGAYNVSYLPLIAEASGGSVRIEPAPFDSMTAGWDGMLVNADWDDGEISSYAKGRGIGDCGVAQRYAWDGGRFRLVEQSEMGECRGSVDFITTWRARVVKD
jgi:hypothetical protein